ncbi:hypothetical protein GOV12_06835 [Candidatus Pacearchaeota archaeon]|nr:hypothetical protein [Candidatus Pacearchaeota archaeon]
MLLNKPKIKILQEFTKNKDNQIYGRAIAKKHNLNQKTISNILNNLEEQEILKFKKEGKNKYYFLNKRNPEIKEIIQLVEINKKINFTKKHIKLKGLFEKLEKKTKGILIVFGSYVKNIEKKDSDLDLFVLGDIENIKKLEESFGIDINIVKSTINKFNKNNPFIKEIMENHVILKGAEEFINLIWQI